jgi:hypothetical protein
LELDKSIQAILTVSSILFGFLFAGFWWALNREITFQPAQRHFKPGTGMLFVSMVLIATFGIILPLRIIAYAQPLLLISYRGILLGFVVVFGYMLTELGHYSMFQFPKYTTRSEWIWVGCTLLLIAVFTTGWLIQHR